LITGYNLPIVGFESDVPFDVDSLIKSIPNIRKAKDQVFATNFKKRFFMRIHAKYNGNNKNAGAT
jgi:hypothetical protein